MPARDRIVVDEDSEELTELRGLAGALVAALTAAIPAMLPTFLLAETHGCPYTGPTFGNELEGLRDYLDAMKDPYAA